MTKARRSERRNQELYQLARKLIRLRKHLKQLTSKRIREGSLTPTQVVEVRSLSASIKKTKEALINRGADPKLLSNDKKLANVLKPSKGRMHMSAGQSGGVGVYGIGNKRKHWS